MTELSESPYDDALKIIVLCPEKEEAKSEIEAMVRAGVEKFALQLGEGRINVHLKKQKEQFRGLSKRECHLAISTTNLKTSIHSHGWGSPQAIKTSFDKLRTVISKNKD